MKKETNCIIVITVNDEVARAEYSGKHSLDAVVGGNSQLFLTTTLPVMSKLADGRKSLPTVLFCKGDSSESLPFNAVASLLSGKEIRGNVAMIVREDCDRGFHSVSDNRSGADFEVLCECWTAEDTTQMFIKLNKAKISELRQNHERNAVAGRQKNR